MNVSPATRQRAVTAAALGVVGLISVSPALAVDGTWSATPADSDWANAANWNGGNVPGATSGVASTDTAFFGATSNAAVTVDANRNVLNLTFNGGGGGTAIASYTLSGGPLVLSSGGLLRAFNGATNNVTVNAPMTVAGSPGSYTFQSDLPGTNRLLTLGGAITGAATAGNVTSVTLGGTSAAANLTSGIISDGTAGGTVALTKAGTGLWVINSAINTYTGGTTIAGGTLRLTASGNSSGSIGTGGVTFTGGTLRFQNTATSTLNNALTVAAGNTGTLSFRATGVIALPTATGTGLLNLVGDTGITAGATSFANFAGTVDTTGLPLFRLNTGYVVTSLQNAAVTVGTGTTQSTQFGTNGAITIDFGSLSGGGSIGGSATGTGTITYRIGARNESTTFAGTVVNGSTTTALTKVGTGTLTLQGANTYAGVTTVSAGTLRATTPAQAVLLAGTGATNGTNIQNGEVDFVYADAANPVATIRAALAASYTDPTTPGVMDSGTLRSSTSTANRGLGYRDDGPNGVVIVKTALFGDANLDGGVLISDFNIFAPNFGSAGGKVWADGDFNYDGNVNIGDFNLLAVNFGQSLPPAADWAPLIAFAAAHDDLATFAALTGVPEPTGLGLLAAGATLALRRRRA